MPVLKEDCILHDLCNTYLQSDVVRSMFSAHDYKEPTNQNHKEPPADSNSSMPQYDPYKAQKTYFLNPTPTSNLVSRICGQPNSNNFTEAWWPLTIPISI